MEQEGKADSLFGAYRVLDLSSECLCGKMLGDLGADVIKIEPPGGDAVRRIGPFYHDIPDPEKSLFWFAYNTSKRGITLNLETPDGRQIFKRLVKTADFVIESFPPGYMEQRGLGYPVLSETNPRIILTSITPFGQAGPYRDYIISDLVAMAMGGLMFLCGDPDRAPVRCTTEQAFVQAGAQACAGTIIAHYRRELTGEGQWVDMSVRESILATLWYAQHQWDLLKTLWTREGAFQKRAHLIRREVYPCQDGFVCWLLMTYQMGRRTQAVVDWMVEEGMASQELRQVKWEEIDINDITQEQEDKWEEEFTRFFLTQPKERLVKEGLKRGTLLMPCSSISEVVQDEQLESRDFWVKVEHSELGDSITYPGAPFKSSEARWRIWRRAPLIGEHNEEIYEGELGFSKEHLVILKQGNVI